MAVSGMIWSLISNGVDAVLCVPLFSQRCPDSARIIIKGEDTLLETMNDEKAIIGRIILAPSALKSGTKELASSGQFGSIMILEENPELKSRYLYSAVICVISNHKSPRST